MLIKKALHSESLKALPHQRNYVGKKGPLSIANSVALNILEYSTLRLFFFQQNVCLCMFVQSRHHYSVDYDHHNYGSVSVHASGIICESGGHLFVDQLPVCVSVRHRVRSCQLLYHQGGNEETQTIKGQSFYVTFSVLSSLTLGLIKIYVFSFMILLLLLLLL